MKFGSNVKAVRKQKGITQVELANATGYRQASIAKIEADRANVPLSKMISIANALDVPLGQLIEVDLYDMYDEDNERLLFSVYFHDLAKVASIDDLRQIKNVAKALIGDKYGE